MLIICTTSKPFMRLKLTHISTSGEVISSHTLIPIFFPLGSILVKILNLRLRFSATSTTFSSQLKILAKDFLKAFSIRSSVSWYKLLFIDFVVVKNQKNQPKAPYILDIHNFAVDVQPQIHGAITRVKGDSTNIVSLIPSMNFGRKLWKHLTLELGRDPISHPNKTTPMGSIQFKEYPASFLFNLDSCFTQEFAEIQTTPFGREYAEMPIKGISKINSSKWMMTPKIELAIKMDRALFLGYSHNPNNYYHFLCEQFPRLLIWLKRESSASLPIICDEDAPWQIQKLIEETTNIRPLVIRRDRLYLFQTLTVCQDFRHAQLPNALDLTLDNTFDSHRFDLLSVRDFLSALYTNKFDGQNSDYLFLGRPANGTRRPKNQDSVERILVNQYGFYSPDMNKLSIGKQIELFSSAKVIVGVGGASLTNLMFCKPNTLFVLQSDTFNSTSRFWPDFASLFNLDIRDITKREDVGADKPYDINIEELLEILNEWRALQPK